MDTYLIGDLVLTRLQGVLTAAERQLVKSLPPERGRDLVKQIRFQLLETARPIMEAMIKEATGVRPLSMHHDISTVTGEEVLLVTLAESPVFRPKKTQTFVTRARAAPVSCKINSVIESTQAPPPAPKTRPTWQLACQVREG